MKFNFYKTGKHSAIAKRNTRNFSVMNWIELVLRPMYLWVNKCAACNKAVVKSEYIKNRLLTNDGQRSHYTLRSLFACISRGTLKCFDGDSTNLTF